jgi:hypothetical protein
MAINRDAVIKLVRYCSEIIDQTMAVLWTSQTLWKNFALRYEIAHRTKIPPPTIFHILTTRLECCFQRSALRIFCWLTTSTSFSIFGILGLGFPWRRYPGSGEAIRQYC